MKKLFALLLALVALPAFAQITVTARYTDFDQFNNDGTYVITASCTNGGLCVLGWYGSQVPTAVTDNSSGTPAWTEAFSTNSGLVKFYYRENVTGSPTAVNVSHPSGDIPAVCVWDLAGAATSSAEDSAGDVAYAASGETFAANHAMDSSHANSGSIVVGYADGNGNTRTFTGGTGVTVTAEGAAPHGVVCLDRIAAGAGPTTMAWTVVADASSNGAFTAFNRASGGGLVCNPISGRCGTVAPPIR